MTDLVVLARSGGGGDLVAQTLRELGLSVVVSATSCVEPLVARIAVIYSFELFPLVMTDHWVRSVRTSPAIWAEYRNHLPCMQKPPQLASELTRDDWARNVDNAVRRIIGKYDLLNGSVEAYQRDIARYTPTTQRALHTIDLARVLYSPERAVEELATIADVKIDDREARTRSLSTRVAEQQQQSEPWLSAYYQLIENT